MTPSPEPKNNPRNPSSKRLWLVLLSRVGVPLVLVGLLTIVGGMVYGWFFITQKLAPIVEASLSKSLDRPVRLGKIEGVSLASLRFGKSDIPATATDRDRAAIESVKVGFNLWQVILTRKLDLDVTLIKPNLYLDQDKDGAWIETQISAQTDTGTVTTELKSLRFEDATLELAPFPELGKKRISVNLNRISGDANIFDRSRRIAFDLDGQSTTGGKFNLKGELLNNQGANFNFNVRGQNFLVAEIDRLVKLPIDLTQGRGNGNFNVILRPKARSIVKGTAQFKDVALQVPQLPQTLTRATGNLQVNDTVITLENTTGTLGKIPLIANGKIDTQKGFDLAATVRNLAIADFVNTFKVQLPVATSGVVNADVKLTGAIDQPIVSGNVRSAKPTKVDRFTLTQAITDFRLNTQTQNLAISNLRATPTVGGQLSGDGVLNLGTSRTIAFNVRGENLPGDQIAKLYNASPSITVGRVNTQAQISGTLDNVQTIAQWQAPEATYPGTGEIAIANGNATLRNTVLQVADGTVTATGQTVGQRWEATVGASGIRAAQFVRSVAGRVSGNFKLAGRLSSFNLADIQINGQARLTEGIGNINAKINAIRGQWKADTQIASIGLKQFSPDLRGQLTGNLNVTGTVNSFSPSNIRANGRVRLSEGISLITDPIAAQIAWNGRNINVQQATAPGFSANGTLFTRLEPRLEITALDLDIRTTGYALVNLPIPRPPVTQLSGAVDLTGRLTGTPAAPRVVGSTTVRGLSLNGIAFDPILRGNLQLNPTGGFNVQVAGTRDAIALALNPAYRPISLDVQRGSATVIGRATANNLFAVNVRQLELDGFILPGVNTAALGGFGGQLSGNFNIDLDQLRVVNGALAVDNPHLGTFRGERISTRFVNRNNVFQFDETIVRRDSSQYALSGNLDLRSQPQFDGQVVVSQGRLEDILQTLQISQISDLSRGLQSPTYGRAADLKTAAVGTPERSLDDQLKRFSEIIALLRQRATARQEQTIPELTDVRGEFNGTIDFSASLQSGVQAEFDLSGKNIEWRPYPSFADVVNGQVQRDPNRIFTAEQAIAKGTLENGVVNLSPLQLRSGEAAITLRGQFGGEQQSGQLTIANLPVDEINRIYPLPLGISGRLNASAFIQGRRDNPFALGEVNLTDGFVNGTQIQSATGNFNYTNARLSVSSTIAIAGPEPIQIEGSIPYRLPFATTFPESDQIDLKLDVKNEGLAFFNLLTPQIAWQGGQGAVQLQVTGRLLQPIATGTATFSNATIAAQALPDPLTGVTGSIQFDRDRIRVQSLNGQYSQGQVSAQGVLPIFGTLDSSDPDAANLLGVSLDRLAINLKGLYRGAVNGNVSAGGTAFAPQLSGEVRLTDGQVLIPDNTASLTAGDSSPDEASGNEASGASLQQPLEFNNLKLVLGDRVRVVSPPIINFLARGNLFVNGTLNNPEPEGTIALKAGQVNLFTTQFVLARGYPQTATFTRSQGLDPTLDVRLIASVPEVTRNRISTTNISSEVRDDSLLATGLGSLQTVRIQAKATGRASQLFENLDLTSSPGRSRGEIIGLIGGGFVNTLGRGDSTLGIANLAGSALLTNIQGFIGNAIGLSEFRLFPTLQRSDRRRESTLGLAAEVGVDITGRLSASALRVLTSDQPTQFGIRYRINDGLLFRGSTDFSGDSRAIFEYETRF
ncbi:MAG: translocation/assembly module TamB domain-containing protein [Myxacorys californica WJT36-NPBG1]|jgi:translocation and assembly module TamB|nr:translocation/assembly module TamB domain-containing protein [Myxacorys californica WJT36-NPBG1]